MAKVCLYEPCNYPRWGGKYCKYHQYLRTDKKPKKAIPRTPIRSSNRKSGERSKLHKQDLEFFASIWSERPHVCFETDEPLGNEPLTLFFHHVLPKGERRFKKYRYKEWNIVLLCWQSHSNENYLKLLPRVLAYRNYLIENLTLIDEGKLIPSPIQFYDTLRFGKKDME